MPAFKTTFLFREGSKGFSESYYQDTADYDTLRPNSINLLQARYALMNGNVKIVGIRNSRPDVFRDSRFISGAAAPLNTLIPGYPNDHGTEIDVALLVRLEAGPLHRRGLLLRGLPEIVVDSIGPEPVYNPNPPASFWPSTFLNFSKALRGQPFLGVNAGQWGLYVNDPNANPQVGATSILVGATARDFSFVTTLPIQFQPTPPPPLPAVNIVQQGYPLVITQAKGTHGINGRWRLFNVNPVPPAAGPYTYRVFPENHLVASPDPLATMKVRALSPQIFAIDSVQDETLANRKTGRFFGQPAGRRRAQL